jgi:hypothetical protein
MLISQNLIFRYHLIWTRLKLSLIAQATNHQY